MGDSMVFQSVIIITILSYAPFLFIFVTLYFVIFFFRKYIVSRHKMYGFLTFFFFTYLLQDFFRMGIFAFESISMDLATISFVLREISSMLVLYSLVVLLEVFEKDVSFSRKQTIMTIFIFTAIGGMISTPTFVSNETMLQVVAFSNGEIILALQIILSYLAGFWLTSMLYRNYKSAWSTKQKKMMRWLSIG